MGNSQQFDNLLVKIAAVPRSKDTVLLRSLLLDGSQFAQNGCDREFLFFHFDRGIADLDSLANAFGGIVATNIISFSVGLSRQGR